MPYTSMPAWPNLTDQDVSDLAYFIKSFSPTSPTPRSCPKPVPLPSAPSATKESVEAGKKLYEETGCIRCHGTLGRGDGPSAPTLKDDWGYPIRAANLAQSWTFRGGSSREDIFRTMSTGFNGTPMPGFARCADARATLGDHRLHRLPLGERRASLHQPRRRQARPETRSIWPRAPRASSPRLWPAFRSSGRSWSRDARSIRRRPRVSVQAIYDAESIALLVRWHDMSAEKTGTNGPSLPVPPEEEEEAAPRRRGAGRRRERLWRRGSRPGAGRPGASRRPEDPFAEAERRQPASHPSSPTPSRSRFPSQVPTGARKPYFIFGDAQNSVDLWFFDLARPEPLQFTGQGSADIAPNDTGDLTGVASYDQGEWSVIFKRPLRATLGRAVCARRVHADRLLGLGRVLARAWQQARSHGRGTPFTSSQKSSHRPSAR